MSHGMLQNNFEMQFPCLYILLLAEVNIVYKVMVVLWNLLLYIIMAIVLIIVAGILICCK